MKQTGIGVLFVCLGNICRSPSAQGILQQRVQEARLSDHVTVDSCGTAAFNVGRAPDPRAVAAASSRGYDIGQLIARQIDDNDYDRFDYIIAMDRSNLSSISAWAPADFSGEIELFMRYCPGATNSQIADPYYDNGASFDRVIATLENAADGLLQHLCDKHDLHREQL